MRSHSRHSGEGPANVIPQTFHRGLVSTSSALGRGVCNSLWRAGAVQPISARQLADLTFTVGAMAYFAYSPMPAMQKHLREAFGVDQGLQLSTPRDRRCLFAWAPFSRLKRSGALHRSLQGSLVASSYLVHTTLVHKDRLQAALAQLQSPAGLATVPLPPSTTPAASGTGGSDHHDAAHAAWTELAKQLGAPPSSAILKHSRTNNAFNVSVVTSPEQLAAALEGAGSEPSGCWLLQQYAPRPLLADGCKWTARVNVLCVGRLVVCVHEAVVVHVAGVAWDESTTSAAQHITNHSLQSTMPGYSRKRQTKLLSELVEGRSVKVRGKPLALDSAMRGVASAVQDVWAAACLPGGAKGFMPQKGAFEVFGVDLLPCLSEGEEGVRWCVLEVNEGPALEALALPSLNRSIVQDTVQLLTSLEPLSEPGGASSTAPAAHSDATHVQWGAGCIPHSSWHIVLHAHSPLTAATPLALLGDALLSPELYAYMQAMRAEAAAEADEADGVKAPPAASGGSGEGVRPSL